jgi:hypothetical protein
MSFEYIIDMRTTIRLNDSILHQAKRLASDRGVSFTALMEESLRLRIDKESKRSKAPPVKLKVFHGNGLRPGIDLDNTASIYDKMDNT